MRLVNDATGYGAAAKALHWASVASFGAQFAVGYRLDDSGAAREPDCDATGSEALEEACEEAFKALKRQTKDEVAAAWSALWQGALPDGGLTLPEAHVLLGLGLVLLGTARLVMRRLTRLPDWDPRLTPLDRRIMHRAEQALLASHFLVPLSGVLLVVVSDDLLPAHIAAHAFFAVALAAHLVVVLRRRLLPRMLPG